MFVRVRRDKALGFHDFKDCINPQTGMGVDFDTLAMPNSFREISRIDAAREKLGEIIVDALIIEYYAGLIMGFMI